MSTVNDPLVAEWLNDGPGQGPRSGLERALNATRAIEQRPRWAFVSGWMPHKTAAQASGPHIGLVPLLIILSALLLMILGVIYVGSQSKQRIPRSIGPSAQRLIAYEDGTHISVSLIDGTGRRVISRDLPRTSSPVFSKDGSKVAFLSRTNPTDAGSELYVVRVDGSPPIAVSADVQVFEADTPEFSWSPDGTKIAFASAASPTVIYVAQADGSGVSAITDNTASRDLPSWETNGDRVAYRAIEADGVRQLLEAVDPTSGQVTTIDAVIGPGAQMSRLAWSPSEDDHAHAVSYVSQMGYGGQGLVVIDFLSDPNVDTFGIHYPWTEDVGGNQTFGTRWSPDGNWLAILTARDGVVLAQNDTTHETNSVEYNGQIRHLGNVAGCWIDWSPDGTALYGGSPNGCTGTVIVPVDDPSTAFTTYTPMAGAASWQPEAP